MPQVISSVTINAPFATVWDVARKVEEFPEFMPDLKSLDVIERSDDGMRTVTAWVGIIKEFKMTVKWTQEDVWDEASRTCDFKMLKGDLSKFDGVWKFEETPDGVKFDSDIEWEYDVPLIGAMIKNLIGVKMKENTDNILNAIKEKAESL